MRLRGGEKQLLSGALMPPCLVPPLRWVRDITGVRVLSEDSGTCRVRAGVACHCIRDLGGDPSSTAATLTVFLPYSRRS